MPKILQKLISSSAELKGKAKNSKELQLLKHYANQSIPKDAKGFQRIPKDAKGFQTILKNSKGFQRIPKNSKGLQRIPKDSKEFQRISKDSKEFQRILKDSKELEMESNSSSPKPTKQFHRIRKYF